MICACVADRDETTIEKPCGLHFAWLQEQRADSDPRQAMTLAPILEFPAHALEATFAGFGHKKNGQKRKATTRP